MRIPVGIERKPFGEYAAERQRDIDAVRRGGLRRSADAAQRRLDRQKARETAREQRKTSRGQRSR